MLSRLRRLLVPSAALIAVTLGAALLAVSCEKVPLLAPTGSALTVIASATALPINGSTDLTAQVVGASGYAPHSGTLISFTTTLGTVQPSSAETDTSGRVTVKFLAGASSGTATITAQSGGAGGGTTTGTTTTTGTDSRTVKIAIGAAAVAALSLNANPGTVPASGGTSTIVATVRDSNGNVLAGVPVSFSTDNGSLSASSVNTDQNGSAQTVLTTSKVSKITATAGTGTTSGTGTTTTGQTQTVTVSINAAGQITVGTASPSAPTAGQTVTFTLLQPAGSTPIQRTAVDWGDGGTSSYTGLPGAISHAYTSPGTYTPRVTATDSFGDTWTGTGTVTVDVKAQPTIAAFAVSPAAPTVGQAATFSTGAIAPGKGATIQGVTIDFGDGQSASFGNVTSASVSHVYSTAGTYTATAIVRDSAGATASAVVAVPVSARPQIVVALTLPTGATPTAGAVTTINIAATAPSGSSIQSISVKFDDGGLPTTLTGNATSVQHVYTAGGTYTVTATATDTLGNTGSGSLILVVSGSAANFTVTPSAPVHNVQVVFDASASSLPSAIASYLWDFGDGNTITNTTSAFQSHTFTTAGNYAVKLTATDTAGHTATVTKVITVS